MPKKLPVSSDAVAFPHFGDGSDPVFSSDWFRVPRACQYTQWPQSVLYHIIENPDNEIITFTLKLRKGQKRGMRYIWRPSLDAFLHRQAVMAGIDPEAIRPQSVTTTIREGEARRSGDSLSSRNKLSGDTSARLG